MLISGFTLEINKQWRQVKILKLRYNNIYYLFTELYGNSLFLK